MRWIHSIDYLVRVRSYIFFSPCLFFITEGIVVCCVCAIYIRFLLFLLLHENIHQLLRGGFLFSFLSSLLSSNYYRHPSLLLLLQMPFIWRDQQKRPHTPPSFPSGWVHTASEAERSFGFFWRVVETHGATFYIFFTSSTSVSWR